MIHSPSQCVFFSQYQCGILPFNVLHSSQSASSFLSPIVLLPLNQLDSSSQPTSFLSTNDASFPQPTSSLLLTNEHHSSQPTCCFPSTKVLHSLIRRPSFPQPTSSFLSPTVPHPPNQRRILSRCHPTQEPPPKAYKDLCFCEVHQHPRIKKAVLECIFLFFLFFHAVNSLRDQKGRECGVCQIFLFSLCRLKNVLLIVKRNI